jgi:hypothetical protein
MREVLRADEDAVGGEAFAGSQAGHGGAPYDAPAEEEVKDEILKRLDALSEKLGQTGGHLWEVLVRQAYIDAWSALVFALLIAAFLVSFLVAGVKLVRAGSKDYDDEWKFAVGIVLILVGGFLTIPSLSFLWDARYIFNPEAAALQTVLRTLSGR